MTCWHSSSPRALAAQHRRRPPRVAHVEARTSSAGVRASRGSADRDPQASGSRAITSSSELQTNRREAAARPTRLPCPFEFTAGTRDGGIARRRATGDEGPTPGRLMRGADVQALSFSDNARGQRAGRLRRLRDRRARTARTSATTATPALDVKDKIVLVLRYFPEDADHEDQGHSRPLLGPALQGDGGPAARREGLLVVTGPRSPNAGETIPMSFDTALAGLGHRGGQHQRRGVAKALLRRAAGQDARGGAAVARLGQPARGRLRDPDIDGHASRRQSSARSRPAHNIVAYLPATSAPPASRNRGWRSARTTTIWGTARTATRWRSKDEAGQIHSRRGRQRVGHGRGPRHWRSSSPGSHGAATSCSTSGRVRNSGCVGSTAFVAKPPMPIDQIAAYLNFDMVGRMQDNKLTVQATGTSAAWATNPRTRQRRRRIRSAAAAGSRISRPTWRASTRPACRA